MRRSSRPTSKFKESHKKQYLRMKIERGQPEDWRMFLKINPKEKALITDLQKTDKFNPFSEESKKIMSSTSNYVTSLQKPNARLVLNIPLF